MRRHVIIETNKTTARIFPQVPDCENALFWERMERLVVLNQQLVDIGASDAPAWQKNLRRCAVLSLGSLLSQPASRPLVQVYCPAAAGQRL